MEHKHLIYINDIWPCQYENLTNMFQQLCEQYNLSCDIWSNKEKTNCILRYEDDSEEGLIFDMLVNSGVFN